MYIASQKIQAKYRILERLNVIYIGEKTFLMAACCLMGIPCMQ